MPRKLSADQEVGVRICKLLNRMQFARYEVLAAVLMKSHVFWGVTLC
jgi:hypothetical protein